MLLPERAVAGTLIAAAVTAAATPLWIALARRAGAVDLPDARKIHVGATPRWGGAAVFAGLLCGFYWLDGPTVARQFGGGAAAAYLGGSALVFLIGAIDDRWRLRAPLKFGVHVLAALWAWYCGVRMTAITAPWSGESLELGLLSLPTTLFWIVFLTNAWNLIDGLDGLAAALGFIAAAVFALMLVLRQFDHALVLVVPLIGALLGFLPYNLNPARIFLGDSGSYLIGYQLALVAVLTGQKGVTSVAVFGPLLIVAVPVLDTLSAIVRRLARPGSVRERLRAVVQPDRQHLHHRALARGWSQRKAMIVISLASVAMGGLGLLSTFARSPRLGGALLLVAVTLFLVLYAGGTLRNTGADPRT